MFTDELSDEDRARIAVADELRRLLHELVGRSHDPASLQALAQRLAAEGDALESSARREKSTARWDYPEQMLVPGDGQEFTNPVDRPVSGRGNPWSIPLRVFREGDTATTTVRLGRGLEGAPMRSHGGVVAAIFDDLFGFLMVLRRTVAYTASLTVDWVAPIPIEVPITFTAWVEEWKGRKARLAADCRNEGELLATCEALFIEPRS